MEIISRERCQPLMTEIIKESHIAIPPKRGIGYLCILLWSGISMALNLTAIILDMGTKITVRSSEMEKK
jgi:hypothetical protein